MDKSFKSFRIERLMSGNVFPTLLAPADLMYDANKCYAVKVRSRAETNVSKKLCAKGYKVLVPSYTTKQRYSDRTKVLDCVLFPGYIFVWFNVRELLPLVSTAGVDYVVKSGGVLQPLSVEEIALIETLAIMREECQPCAQLTTGQRVRIDSGPLHGQQGQLVRYGKSNRVVISIESISSAVNVIVMETMLTALK